MNTELVLVRDYAMQARVLAVYDATDKTVLVTSKENLERLRKGQSTVPPVGFPRHDVFAFQGSPSRKPDWTKLTQWVAPLES